MYVSMCLEPIFGDQKALAFTTQQYAVAENIMGRVNILTNLQLVFHGR